MWIPIEQTWVELTPRVEGSAVDVGRKSVTADGLGDVGIKVPIKPEQKQKEFEHFYIYNSFIGGAGLAFDSIPTLFDFI